MFILIDPNLFLQRAELLAQLIVLLVFLWGMWLLYRVVAITFFMKNLEKTLMRTALNSRWEAIIENKERFKIERLYQKTFSYSDFFKMYLSFKKLTIENWLPEEVVESIRIIENKDPERLKKEEIIFKFIENATSNKKA